MRNLPRAPEGEPTNSCLVFTAELDGADIVTVEGLAQGDTLHPVQHAFIARGAAQCGCCTPGFLIAATPFLRSNPHPTEEQVRVVDRCGLQCSDEAVRRQSTPRRGINIPPSLTPPSPQLAQPVRSRVRRGP